MRRAPNPWDRFYHEHQAPWRGERPVSAWLPIEGRALELGCGNGKLLRPLRSAGVDVVGLDISYHAARRVGGVLADASVLPFVDGAFDVVFDVHCTGHLLKAGRARALAEIHRVLAPGGRYIVERLTPQDLRASNGDLVETGTRRLQDGRTTHFSEPATLHASLEAAGFEVLATDQPVRTQRIKGRDHTRASVQITARRR